MLPNMQAVARYLVQCSPLSCSLSELGKSVHSKHKYLRRKRGKRAWKEYTERWVIKLKTKENIKYNLPHWDLECQKWQATNTLHSLNHSRSQVTPSKGRAGPILTTCPLPTPDHRGSQITEEQASFFSCNITLSP